MTSYHVNLKGAAGICRAAIDHCPFGGVEKHYATRAEALEFYEKIMAEQTVAPVLRKKKRTFKSMLQELNPFHQDKQVEHRSSLSNPEDSDAVFVDGVRVPFVEDEERSAFLCPHCEKQISWEEESSMIAGASDFHRSGCGEKISSEDAILGIREDALWVLRPEEYGKNERSVYHVTTNPEWDQKIKDSPDLFIHLGSLEATKYRAQDLHNEGSTLRMKFYRYEMRLKPPMAPVQPIIQSDYETMWEDQYAADGMILKERMNFYHNRHEDPGSISLATTQENFEIIGRTEFSEMEIWD